MTPSIPSVDAIAEEGRRAYDAGKPRSLNPYRLPALEPHAAAVEHHLPGLARRWEAGWRAASEEDTRTAAAGRL
jgi:hypothetical protein